MKKFITMLCASIAIASCSKTEPTPNPVPPPPASTDQERHYIASIEKFTVYEEGRRQSVNLTEYHYDANKRLQGITVRYTMMPSAVIETTTLSYPAGSILMQTDEHKTQSNLTQATEYRLTIAPTSKRPKQFEHIPYFSAGPNTRTESGYTFDSVGRQTSYTSSFLDKASITWHQGNIGSIRYDREYWVTEQRTYSEHKNTLYPDLSFYFTKMYLSPQMKYVWTDELGLRSTHLPKSISYESGAKEYLTRSNKYSYELDDKGRVRTITEQEHGSKGSSVYLLTYLPQ